jgi:hypothetical protein
VDMEKMRSNRAMRLRLGFTLLATLVAASCSDREPTGLQKFDYPEPRYLRSLVSPSPSELLAAARIVVKQPYGMAALAKAQPGWTVHIFLPFGQDMNTFRAIQQAWAERGIKAIPVQPWEVTGETPAIFKQRLQEAGAILHGEQGFKEPAHFDAKYYPYLPPEARKETGHPIDGVGLSSFPAVNRYLNAHPDIRHIFIISGGGTAFFCGMLPDQCHKMVGNWTYLNPIDIGNHGAEYPGDLWNLVEEVIARPASEVSEGRITDPQGTDLRWTMTPAQAGKWAGYVRSPVANNHLFLYPMPEDSTTMEGVVSGTANHVGYYPKMTVTLDKHGRPVKVEGGGRDGDFMRALFTNPKLNRLPNGEPVCLPRFPECGYWFLGADGYATNPKKVRNFETLTSGTTELSNVWERERAGVIHFAFVGINHLAVKRDVVQKALKTGGKVGFLNSFPDALEYGYQHKLPIGHTGHIHNYFPTIRWRLRDTGEWITISDKGRPTAFDNPEVRALAAKYGDPDVIFRYDWIPGIPGVNVAGDVQAFNRDPWAWVAMEWKQMKNGTYKFFVDDYQMTKVAVPK